MDEPTQEETERFLRIKISNLKFMITNHKNSKRRDNMDTRIMTEELRLYEMLLNLHNTVNGK